MLKPGDRVDVYKNVWKNNMWRIEKDFEGIFISFGVDTVEHYGSFSTAIIEKNDGFLINVGISFVRVKLN